MLLTKENYKQILDYLNEHGVKDIDLPDITGSEVNESDFITILHNYGNRKITLQEFQRAILRIIVYKDGGVPVEDMLTSDNSDAALSANMGRVLNESVTANTEAINTARTELSELIELNKEIKADYTSVITVGNLDANTDLTGLSSRDILKKILLAEYIPYYHEGSATISIPATLASVGNTVITSEQVTIGGEKPYTSVSGQSNVYSGDVNESSEITINTSGVTLSENVVTSAGTVIVSYSRVYDSGTDSVVTSFGNSTNELASSAEVTKVGNGVIDTGTKLEQVEDYYVIKGLTYTVNTSIKYVYPILINGTSYLKDSTSFGDDKTITKAATEDNPFTFKLPSVYTQSNVKLYYYDQVTAKWVNVQYTLGDPEEISMGENNYTVVYNTYSFADNSGSRPYKITFTTN